MGNKNCLKSQGNAKAINASISAIPVTISAFNIGMLEMLIKIFWKQVSYG